MTLLTLITSGLFSYSGLLNSEFYFHKNILSVVIEHASVLTTVHGTALFHQSLLKGKSNVMISIGNSMGHL